MAAEYGTQVDLSPANANPAALRDLYRSVMKRILWGLGVMVFACRGCIHLTRVLPAQGLMRPLVVVDLDKRLKSGLLLQEVVAGRSCRLRLEGQMQPLVAPILLGMARLDALDGDTEAQPPDGQPTQTEQGMG